MSDRQQVLRAVLASLDPGALREARCCLTGGARLVLELDGYRATGGIDFVCVDWSGYRLLRAETTARRFGALFREPPVLREDILTDAWGLRAVLDVSGESVPFEVSIPRAPTAEVTDVESIPVPVTTVATAIADKLLANADRGLDRSTRSKDLVDLAFMAVIWPVAELRAGASLALSVYGEAITPALDGALTLFADPRYRRLCVEDLEVARHRQLDNGLGALRRLLAELSPR